MKSFLVTSCIFASLVVSVLAATCPDPPTADSVFKLEAYLGRWYEIGTNKAFRNGFEKGLVCTTANYSLNGDLVKVDNGGRKENPVNGTVKQAIGKAKVVEGAKLKVSFFGPFYGPYWIIDLLGEANDGYSVSLVFSCSTGLFAVEDLWLLSRTPQLPSGVTWEGMLGKAQKLGINTTALGMTQTYQGSDCVYGW